ncbi:MAG: DEAD/DEAH box helicase [Chloroflexota bacterium]|nr:DEAD/DEAH box helicase [Chloroflexota bacterium]
MPAKRPVAGRTAAAPHDSPDEGRALGTDQRPGPVPSAPADMVGAAMLRVPTGEPDAVATFHGDPGDGAIVAGVLDGSPHAPDVAGRPRDPATEAIIEQFSILYPFPLDGFQREGIRTLLGGESVMVAAPTGTGKTVVAEFGIYEAFRRNGRVLYTTPIKALSNQKFRDLRAIYGDDVGLLTGDVSENAGARAVVMTTEVLRNMLLQTPWSVDDVDTVIFDEIHYLADPERGTTWEEAIILCPEHVQLICLSATVSNAAAIAAWIGRTHRPIRLITHTRRSVPLSLAYFTGDELHEVIDHTGRKLRDFRDAKPPPRRPGPRQGRDRTAKPPRPADEPQAREIIDALGAKGMLPVIYFLFSRNDCQSEAERLATMRPHLITPDQAARIETVLGSYLASLRPEDQALDQVQLLIGLARRGIGFHHAGLLPVLKQLVEVLFSRGLMAVVFATDTLALGVNMPARTVVIGRMTKWDGRRRRLLLPNEFQQMAGRAGRRGMDAYGYVVVPESPYIPFKQMLEIATGPLLPVRSAFAIRYNTVLNLWDPPEGERVRHMLQQSLAQFQSSQRMRDLEDDIVEIGGDIAGIPHGDFGCLIGLGGGDELLEDYGALVRSLTAAEGRERRLDQDLAGRTAALAGSTPWPEPTRQALRRAFRVAVPGLVIHAREGGWGLLLGRGGTDGVGGDGVGRFLFAGGRIATLAEYRQVDYLTETTLDLPEALVEPPEGVGEARDLVHHATLAALWRRLDRLDLPDLEAIAAEHQAGEGARQTASLARIAAEAAEAVEERRGLAEARGEHPCHACPKQKEHRRNLRAVDELARERSALEDLLARESDAEETRIRGVIGAIRDVLHRFGYLHRGYPTAKADMLADVFDNDGLILCELVDRGWIDHLGGADLAEVFSWYSFDRDYRYDNRFVLPDRLVALRRRLEDLERDVLGEERDAGLFISEGHNPAFYGAARAWCQGASMVEIGEKLQLSEGDLVLTFNKTIDLMRQVREMLTRAAPAHPVEAALREAERLMRRGIVAQSLALGYTPIADQEIAPPEDATDGLADDEPDTEPDMGPDMGPEMGPDDAIGDGPVSADRT